MEECWRLYVMGSRGSLPICGEGFRQFGGATSSYILKRGSYAIILDCGTGLYRAGELLTGCDRIDVLITHVHYDHMVGLLGWDVFPPKARLRFFAQFDRWFGKDTLTRFMGPPFWPYTPEMGEIHEVESPGRVTLEEGVEALFYPSNHPDSASILRLNTSDGAVCAAFDYEHTKPFPESMVKGCSLLLYDAMYTREEYPSHIGWGHSCWEEGCALATRFGIDRLLVTHHDPKKTDADLMALERQAQEKLPGVRFVRAGDVFELRQRKQEPLSEESDLEVGKQRPKILIVDDSEINREILRLILEKEYSILEAENGEEALALLREHETELEGIVLDLIMPKMDGYTFLKEYSKVPLWKEIPVLVATADEANEVENRCLELGAWDFVRKPFNTATVYLRLRNNIGRRQLAALEKQRIAETFQRYMEPAIVEQLLQGGISDQDLRGKSVEIAVLFVDIRGFTSLSEQLDADILVEILNDFLTLTSRAIQKYGGTLDKFIGDCTMAFWGAPLPCENKTYRACQAAMEMVRQGKEFSRRVLRRFGREVSFGIGIHVGTAVVGSFGAPNRKDYTAIGDTVNTASRLESNAPAGTVYISRAVADRLGDLGKVTSLGSSIPLKGKTADVEILTLDGLTDWQPDQL